MGHNVLVFESDMEFAREVQAELGRYGCEVTIVEDVNAGLARAVEQKPDLILLAVELPRMNGFSICNKVKKDAALKGIPLIITSREANAETFESHKKLRWRAEDYLHKPIDMPTLVAHVAQFIRLEDGSTAADEAHSVQLHDEVVISEEAQLIESAQVFPANSMGEAEFEIDASANQPGTHTRDEATVGAVAMTGTPAQSRGSVPPPSSPRRSSRPMRRSHAPAGAGAVSQMPVLPGVHMDDPRIVELEAQVRAANDERDSRITAMQESHRREMERMLSELEEVKNRAATQQSVKPAPGVSGKEFLELRETLNKKDKEMLALRETASKKDKEMIEVRERSLELERRHAELDDRMLANEKELADSKDKCHTLTLDKEQAKKANEDLKARIARVQGDLESRMGDLSHAKAEHAKALEEAAARHTREVEDLRAEQSFEADQTAQQHAAQVEELQNAHNDAVAAATRAGEEALVAKEQAVRSELTAAHQQAMNKQRSELEAKHEANVRDLEQGHSDRVAAVERTHHERVTSLESAHAERVASLQSEHETHVSQLEHEHSTRNNEMQQSHENAVKAIEAARVARNIEFEARVADLETNLHDETTKRVAADERIAVLESSGAELKTQHEMTQEDLANARAHVSQLEENLAGMRAELDQTRESLTLESSAHQRAVAKWDQDRASLNRAKDALAVVLAQIEETEGRQLQ